MARYLFRTPPSPAPKPVIPPRPHTTPTTAICTHCGTDTTAPLAPKVCHTS